MPWLSPDDPHSYCRPDQVIAKHFHWEIAVDFETEVIRGHVDFDIIRLVSEAEYFVLDTGHDLDIRDVYIATSGQRLQVDRTLTHEKFGVCTKIRLPSDRDLMTIRVVYKTSPDSTALLWMCKEQTVGKRNPYVYSRCEGIHARALIPCQDSPSIKTTFTARVQVPQGLTALLSAMRIGQESSPDGSSSFFRFEQVIPMSSYLLAVAAGDIECRKIGPRSHVWSEKELVDKVAVDLEDVEKILTKAEELLCPYVWGMYDILVLPPSFPFDGIESPCLAFISPTILTGEKPLSDVITHVIVHAWTGNLITCKSFEHFWLNKAFTVYIERKLIAQMFGDDVRFLTAQDGLKQLSYCVQFLGSNHPLTRLVVNLDNINPDESISTVVYEKGHSLLYYIETLLGSEAMDNFLRAYVHRFKYKTLDTEQFRSLLYEVFHDKKGILDRIDWSNWLFAPGLPPVTPTYKSSLLAASDGLYRKWQEAMDDEVKTFKKEEFDRLSSRQKLHFFNNLLDSRPISKRKVIYLSELYEMKRVINVEIIFRWLRVGIRARWEGIVDHVESYLATVGQLKFVVPLYRDLSLWPEKRKYALKLYEKLRPNMMYMARQAVDNIGLDI